MAEGQLRYAAALRDMKFDGFCYVPKRYTHDFVDVCETVRWNVRVIHGQRLDRIELLNPPGE